MTRTGAGTLLLQACLSAVVTVSSLLAQQDTTDLAAQLQAIHGKESVSLDQFRRIQETFIRWADARLKQGRMAKMNEELATAGLLGAKCGPGAEPSRELTYTLSGCLDDVTASALSSGVTLISLGIGTTCGYDETVVVYEEAPLKQVAVFTHGPPGAAPPWSFPGFEVTKADARGRRFIAAAGYMQWCTSRYGSFNLRIIELAGSMTRTLLDRQVPGLNSDDRVTAQINGDQVTFEYPTQDFETRTVIETYRVQNAIATLVQ